MSYSKYILEEYYSIEEGKRLRTAVMLGAMGLAGLGLGHKATAQSLSDDTQQHLVQPTRELKDCASDALGDFLRETQPGKAIKKVKKTERAVEKTVNNTTKKVKTTHKAVGKTVGDVTDKIGAVKDTLGNKSKQVLGYIKN